VVVEGNGVGVALLGMAGMRVLDVQELERELELVVETDAAVVGCAGCGVRAVSHGRRDTVVRDLPISGRPTSCAGASACGAATSRRARCRRGRSAASTSRRARR
jgi:hypothetical protein